MLVAGLVVFALASLAAGLARATGPLLAARAVQGIGAALAVPAALALLTALYRHERERRRALGRLSATLDAGMVAGLVLGGVLTASLGWPWCFFVVVPLGLAAAALVPSALAESRDEEAPPLDVAGAALAAAGFGLLALGSRGSSTPAPTAPLTSQGMTGVREGEKGLASGFALAFAVAAGILAIGAITANRTPAARG